MKKISIFFCAVSVALMTTIPAFADMIGPGLPSGPIGIPESKSIWGIIISVILAIGTYIWHLLTHKK